MLSLDDFEDEIDSIILERGEDYWRRGLVLNLKINDNDEYSAEVQGTGTYSVKVRLAGRGILDSKCDCPYNGDYCKHEVAVFYALSRGNKENKKILNTNIDFEKFSKKELINLVKKGRDTSREFDNFIEIENFVSSRKKTKDDYKHIVRESVNDAKGGHGFIDWDRTYLATRNAEYLLDEAENIKKTKPEEAMAICQSCIEVLVPVLQSADDSDGAIGECIEFSFETLEKIASDIQNKQIEEKLFNYCLLEYCKEKYDGWDYPLRFLNIAAMVCNNNNRGKLFKTLDLFAKTGDDFLRNYDAEKVALIKLTVIKKLDSQNSEILFIKENIKYDSIREIAINNALAQKKYNLAKKLAEDGYNLYAKEYVGLAHKYLDFLLKIADENKDISKQKELLLKLFLLTPNRDFTYFDKLHRLYQPGEWTLVLSRIVPRIDNSYDLSKIYFKEKMWRKLLQTVSQSKSPYLVEEYFSKLSQHFPNELVNLYKEMIYEKMKYAGSRGSYAECRKFLERIIFLGNKNEAIAVVGDLKNKYSNRRAMIEELNKIKII